MRNDVSPGVLHTTPIQLVRNGIFFGFHLSVLLVYWAGVSWQALALCLGMYYVRMFGITAGYHRYFAHKSYRTSRVVQFLLALLGTTALQKGVLWWAGHHRNHHTYSDTPQDPHSPRRGFFWAHMGWIAASDSDNTPWDKVPELAKYPELRWLNHLWLVVFVGLCAAFYFLLGFQAMVWGCFVSTVLLWHGTFCINSLTHMIGRKVYRTGDDSRNSFVLALITMGEGWHNNHHYYPAAAHQGFRWYELDMSWYALLLLERLGLIWDVRRAPAEVVAGTLGGKCHLVEEEPPLYAEAATG